MGFDSLSALPQRLSFTNLQNGKTVEVPFNPTHFNTKTTADWARFKVLGLSHQPMHYLQTRNLRMVFPKVYFFADPREGADGIRNMHEKLAYFESLMYPRRSAQDIMGAGPPRVLVVWPNFITLTCVLVDLSKDYKRFNLSGQPLQVDVSIDCDEIRDVRLPSEEVAEKGFRRAPGTGQGGSPSGSDTPSFSDTEGSV